MANIAAVNKVSELRQRGDAALADELLLLDRIMDGILLHEPTHTLSYNIAVKAQQGNWLARLLCHELNHISPNHCANAITDESTQRWQQAVSVVG